MGRLTYRQRQELPCRDFADCKNRKYPIENKAHARDALARVSANGTPKEKALVRRRVHERYPSIDKKKRMRTRSSLGY